MAQSVMPSIRPPLRGARAAGDPLGPILALGRREVRVGALAGLLFAVALHAAAAAKALSASYEVENFAEVVASYVRSNLRLELEIDASEPPPPPPPPPPEAPPPEPEPVTAQAPPPTVAPVEATPAPAPAEAGQVLTADPDPDAPIDLTGEGFVTGTGEFRGGITSSTGTSKTAVRDVKAQPGGVVGGTGTAPAPPGPPARDLSRAAAPVGTSWQDCGFPSEAQLDGVDFGIVKLVVTVGADGRAKSVAVLSDPGSGFGAHARRCALRREFRPALDQSGRPVIGSTPPFTVKFTQN